MNYHDHTACIHVYFKVSALNPCFWFSILILQKIRSANYCPVLNYLICVNEISTYQNIGAMKTKITPLDSSSWGETDSWFKIQSWFKKFLVFRRHNTCLVVSQHNNHTHSRIHTKHRFAIFLFVLFLFFSPFVSYCLINIILFDNKAHVQHQVDVLHNCNMHKIHNSENTYLQHAPNVIQFLWNNETMFTIMTTMNFMLFINIKWGWRNNCVIHCTQITMHNWIVWILNNITSRWLIIRMKPIMLMLVSNHKYPHS